MAVPISLDLGLPPRTIYRDVLNLPDPTQLGITSRIFNDDIVDLYFRLTGSGAAAWSFTTVDIGLIAAATNVQRDFDNFASRTKPVAGDFTAGEFEENITLILRAYTDAGYTNLKWTYERVITVHWIKSNDPAFTVDVLNNFDDGTVQGWAVANELNNRAGYPTLTVVTDYYLSPAYAVKMINESSVNAECRGRLYKSFTTPDKPVIFAIIDIRYNETDTTNWFCITKNITIKRDDTVMVYLGRPYDIVQQRYVPWRRWIRIVVPLPRNTTLEVRIVHSHRCASQAAGRNSQLWLDDFKIVSK